MIQIFSDVNISVVIPCYKVDRFIESVLEGIPDYIDHVILVDDASPGETPEILDRLEKENERVHVLHHEFNLGVGGATVTGYKKALELDSDIVVKMDGDGQMDPDYLPTLLEPLIFGEADYTKGNRFAFAEVLQKMPKMRLVGNAGLSFLNRLASGYWKTLDPTNGYFAIRSEVLRLLNLDRISKRFFFESSQLIELGIIRAVVKDIPMRTIYGDEKSNVSLFKAAFEFPPKLTFGLFRRVLYTKILFNTSPDFLLGSTGMVLFLFGAIWGIVKYVQFAALNIPATAGTVMIAALPGILGVQLLLTSIQYDLMSVPESPLCRPLV